MLHGYSDTVSYPDTPTSLIYLRGVLDNRLGSHRNKAHLVDIHVTQTYISDIVYNIIVIHENNEADVVMNREVKW